MKILIIDDDRELSAMLEEYLAGEGFAVSTRSDGRTGLDQAAAGGFDAVVLDVMLPGLGGFDVLRGLRKQTSVPVIMLTARGEETDRIVGLELGADDYLPKPFNPRELAARLRAITRRSQPAPGENEDTLRAGALHLQPARRRASLHGETLRLTSAEFSILERLIAVPGEVISKDELAEHALGRTLSPFDRSVDTHVSRLRGKLGPLPDGEARIQSVRGQGYVLVADEIADEAPEKP